MLASTSPEEIWRRPAQDKRFPCWIHHRTEFLRADWWRSRCDRGRSAPCPGTTHLTRWQDRWAYGFHLGTEIPIDPTAGITERKDQADYEW